MKGSGRLTSLHHTDFDPPLHDHHHDNRDNDDNPRARPVVNLETELRFVTPVPGKIDLGSADCVTEKGDQVIVVVLLIMIPGVGIMIMIFSFN